MTLTASPNEHSNKLARVGDLLKDQFRVAAKPLPGGDYMFPASGKVVCIEVKWSIGDLLDSLQVVGEASGPRLAVEVRKMLEFADVPIVLVPSIRMRGDGRVLRDDGEPTGWQYSSVKGILADVQLYGCVLDEWAGDIAYRIAQWYYTLQDESHKWVKQRGRPEFITLDLAYREAVWALSAIQGVGPVAAERLLQAFGSIAEVCNQSIKSLQRVKGIGPKVASTLYEGLHRRWE